jgi:omega-6 fatty acid desaturase (delta-12 desaturase)
MEKPAWLVEIRRFEKIDDLRALWGLANSVLPYLALFLGMDLCLRFGLPYWLVLVLAFPAAGFLVRTFIILHDCGHYSFSRNVRINAVVGYFCGVLTFNSFPDFRRSHAIHHATVGNLDKRGVGDVWTMTLEDYRRARPGTRALYRFVRNPFILFLVLAPLDFLVLARFWHGYSRRSDKIGTMATNLAILAMVLLGGFGLGFGRYVAIQLPVMYIASVTGVWLFYIQHQFQGVYWVRSKDWDQIKASLLGSSFYDLPPLLRWFTGNIGFHHVHHLDPRIPNYMLKECHEAVPEARAIKPIGLVAGFKSLSLQLYDEEKGGLISFREARERLRGRA